MSASSLTYGSPPGEVGVVSYAGDDHVVRIEVLVVVGVSCPRERLVGRDEGVAQVVVLQMTACVRAPATGRERRGR
jgi:hypothetical protein